ncbi:YncE family protein [Lampropedia puyangensis]|uniref:YncE family protein n=1 Tax=Lampropedia puyangensis TaxID=1330072 RepID=A0A4S8F611_9BURK|nr:YncE family protein [Lampropedia puyangensis]THU02868.1 YncE family protein [Lampropedia puyangensis]
MKRIQPYWGAMALSIAALATLAGCANSDTLQSGTASAIYQPVNAESVQRKAIAKGLYELVYSPKYQAVFVTSSGGWGEQADTPKVLRLNPHTLAIEAEIPLQRKAFGLAIDEAAGRLYVGNTVDTSLTVVDIQSQRELAVIQLEEKTTGADGKARYARDLRQLVVDPAKQRVYIAAHGFDAGSVLYAINTQTLKVEKKIEGLGQAKAPGILLDAAGERLFVSNLLGEVLTINTRTLTIDKRVKTDLEQPMNMVLDVATNRLFVTDQGSETLNNYLAKVVPEFKANGLGHRVVVLDADSGKALASIPTDAEPLQLWLDSARQRLYVTNRGAGTITVFDSNSYTKLDTIAVPTHPNTLAQDAQENVLFVSIKNGEKDPKDTKESVARIAW